jgi:hypothetical protein
VVKTAHLGVSERAGQASNPARPVTIADDRDPLEVVRMGQADLEVVPGRGRLPAVEILQLQ